MQVTRQVAPFQQKSAHLGYYPFQESNSPFLQVPGRVIHSTVPLQIDPHALRASVPPVCSLCQGCTLPLAILETVKMLKQIQSLRHNGEDMQEWLLSGFTDVTRSYIHSFSSHRNPLTWFSPALCIYHSFTTNSYIFVRSTERALTAFEYFTHCCALIKWSLHSLSGDTEISPNFPTESGWRVY